MLGRYRLPRIAKRFFSAICRQKNVFLFKKFYYKGIDSLHMSNDSQFAIFGIWPRTTVYLSSLFLLPYPGRPDAKEGFLCIHWHSSLEGRKGGEQEQERRRERKEEMQTGRSSGNFSPSLPSRGSPTSYVFYRINRLTKLLRESDCLLCIWNKAIRQIHGYIALFKTQIYTFNEITKELMALDSYYAPTK